MRQQQRVPRDPVSLKYVNEQIGQNIRTTGLALFTTPGKVTAFHRKHLQAIADDPDRERRKAVATYLYQTWATRLFWILILDVFVGWLILPTWTWLGSIAGLIVIFVSWAHWLHKKYCAPELPVSEIPCMGALVLRMKRLSPDILGVRRER